MLAKLVLKEFKIVAPEFMLSRKEIFHRVAEALQSDPQPVEGNLASIAQRLAVQIISGLPALECEL